jgi:hypothetical protein
MRLPRAASIWVAMMKHWMIALVAVVGCTKGKTKDKAEPVEQPKPVEATPAEPPKPAEPAAKPVEPPPAAPAKAAIKLGDLPSGWDRSDEADGSVKLEYVAAVNDSKFPVDNAVFTFTIDQLPAAAPKDAAAYGDWLAGETKQKVIKTEKLSDGVYYEFESKDDKSFQLVKTSGVRCAGSLYRDTDYNKIPKVRDAVLADAKKVCASASL